MVNQGNDGKGNIPERDLWETKQELFDKLNNQYCLMRFSELIVTLF